VRQYVGSARLLPKRDSGEVSLQTIGDQSLCIPEDLLEFGADIGNGPKQAPVGCFGPPSTARALAVPKERQ